MTSSHGQFSPLPHQLASIFAAFLRAKVKSLHPTKPMPCPAFNAVQVHHNKRGTMALDNTERAVLTIGALTKLVQLKKETRTDDACGLLVVEMLERLVINGSVARRDAILLRFKNDGSFDSFFESPQLLQAA